MPSVRIKKSKPVVIMHMIVPGRRALGEDWRKVTVGVQPENDKIEVVENAATEAPTDKIPIFVPALGNISMEMADYILEYRRHENNSRMAAGKRPKDRWEPIDMQRMFHEWLEMKLKMWQGQTVSGPSGTTQRERIQAKRWRLK